MVHHYNGRYHSQTFCFIYARLTKHHGSVNGPPQLVGRCLTHARCAINLCDLVIRPNFEIKVRDDKEDRGLGKEKGLELIMRLQQVLEPGIFASAYGGTSNS